MSIHQLIDIMKRLTFLISFVILIGCKCIGQMPIQVLPVDENCVAILPDYREHVTVRDNCIVIDTIQIPVPGTILDASNPYVNVVIVATDISNNSSAINFDVVILDDEPPTIEIDSSFFFAEYTAEERSALLRAYHNSIGSDMYKAAQGEDSIWTYSYLRDTSYWEPNPWLDADSMFETKGMVMRWEPGFNASSVGSFVESDKYILVNLDSNHLITLGLWPVIEIRIGLPVTIDCAGQNDNWFTQIEGGPSYNYVGAPWSIDEMYKSERYGIFNYKIPVGQGTFRVDLHFCEIYWDNIGSRIFDVILEGEKVLNDFDILSEVNKWVPLTKTYTVSTGFDGYLDIDFPGATIDYGKISGITITSMGQTAMK